MTKLDDLTEQIVAALPETVTKESMTAITRMLNENSGLTDEEAVAVTSDPRFVEWSDKHDAEWKEFRKSTTWCFTCESHVDIEGHDTAHDMEPWLCKECTDKCCKCGAPLEYKDLCEACSDPELPPCLNCRGVEQCSEECPCNEVLKTKEGNLDGN